MVKVCIHAKNYRETCVVAPPILVIELLLQRSSISGASHIAMGGLLKIVFLTKAADPNLFSSTLSA
jgi:hypothetical protein